MSIFGEDNKVDGHTILLMELRQNERTYSDYPTRFQCLNSMVLMYEHSCETNETDRGLTDFYAWLDDFYMIKLFSFDKEISRYKVKTGDSLKNLFEQDDDSSSYKPIENGHAISNGNNSVNSSSLNVDNRDLEMESNDGDDEDNWDD
jgi:hypothetical protein